jgi:ABC-type phosphate transport system substrate-binding protein
MAEMLMRIFALMIAFAACAIPQEGFSVVANKDNPASSISKAQLRRMILGEMTAWPGGVKVLVALGPAGDSARGAALKEICGMGEADYSKHLLQTSFAGGAKPPIKTLPSTAAVRQVVALSPGGIGIVDGTDGGPGVKLLTIQ